MANQIITFPKYLSDPAFQYRKVTIKVIRGSDKADDVAGGFEDIMAKSLKAAQDIAQTTFNAAHGDYSPKDVLDATNNKIQSMANSIKGSATTLYTFVLPLPNSFSDSHSHQWSVDKGVVGTVTSSLSASPVGAAVGKITALAYDMSNQRKPLLDPGYFQNYSGTEPRDFAMSFDLVPNNADEAADMFMILYLMRQYSLPSTAISHALVLAPHYFQIEFSNNYISTLVGATDVVLKNISVDYGADGQMQQTPDGMPKYMKLDLVFSERSMSTNSHGVV